MTSAFETIDAANRRFEQLFNAGQLDDLVALYTPEATLLPPDKNKYHGREAIKKFWEGARSVGVNNLSLKTGTVIEAGTDYLIETSSYQHALDRGNYQVIWKKVNEGSDQWQLDIDIFN